jgi:hypothetical protein
MSNSEKSNPLLYPSISGFLKGLFVFIVFYLLWISYYISNISGIYRLVDITILVIIIPGIYVYVIIWGLIKIKSTSFTIGMLIIPLIHLLFFMLLLFIFSGSSGGTWN